MADQIQCPGCAARFRLHLRPGAPLRADLSCPRCGSNIRLRRRKAPSTHQAVIRAKTAARTTPDEADKGVHSRWHTVDHSAIFGRPPPAPPMAPETPASPGTEKSSVNEPSVPNNDEEDSRPLANALLQKIKEQRAKSSSPTAVLESSTSEFDDEVADPWIDDQLIEETASAAADKLLVIDERPISFERLRGPALEEDSIAALSPPAGPSLAPNPPDDDDPIGPQSEDHEVSEDTASPPDVPPLPETFQAPLTIDVPEDVPEADSHPPLSEELLDSEAAYRLRVGDRVYGDIGFDGLISLFRRGIWVIADDIAVGDGPWMPIESHPIFERVRHAVADGMSNLLIKHARLIDEQPLDDPKPQPQPEAPAPEHVGRKKMAPSPASACDDAEASTGEQTQSTKASVENTDISTSNQSTNQALPWAVAVLMAAGVGVIATSAFFLLEPFADSDGQQPSPAIAPNTVPVDDETDDRVQREQMREHRARITNATLAATDHINDALSIDAAALAERAIHRGEYERARNIAIRQFPDAGDRDALRTLFLRAVSNDPELRHTVRTLTPDQDFDTLRALGGGGSVTLRFTEDGVSRYAYKVARDEWETGWRVEVAAYQLCKLLSCDLYVPYNEPARISRDDFDELYGRLDTPRQRSYAAQRFDELVWHEEQGPDGVEREYVYGTLKEWIPEYTQWPIEYTETWEPWLDISHDEDILDEEFEDYLKRLQEYHSTAPAGLRTQMEGHSTRDVARQLSNLHVFDYLMSNFDRYSGIEDYYGVNSHFANGRFVPLDNSTGFALVEYPVVHRRLMRVQRFSRSLIDAIRMLRPYAIEPALFPNPSDRDRTRLDLFWQQRDNLLDYVDALVEEHGEGSVYAFE